MADTIKITTLAQLKVALQAAKTYTSTVRSMVWAPWQARVRSPTTIWLRL